MRARLGPAARLAASALAAPPSAFAAPEPCAVEVSVEPAAPVTGQQVLYRVRIFRRRDVESVSFATPLAFPDVRAEWLPGRIEDTRVRRDGATFLLREEHRALFVERAGRCELPAFELTCALADGTLEVVPVPAVAFDVADPPAGGRPAGWRGAIGPLHVGLMADTQEIALGDSVQVSVSVRGTGNLWVVPEPFGGRATASGAEIFRRAPETRTEAGERLFVRRFFRMDVVPHEPGTLALPAVEVPYYDPDARRYAVARTEPVEIRVGPRREAHDDPERAGPVAARPGEDGGTGDGPRALGVVAGGGAAVASAGLAALWLRARRARRRRWEPVTQALAQASRARERLDFAAEAAALAKALDAAVTGGVPQGELGRRVRAASEDLDRIRFSATGERADRASVEALIAALGRTLEAPRSRET